VLRAGATTCLTDPMGRTVRTVVVLLAASTLAVACGARTEVDTAGPATTSSTVEAVPIEERVPTQVCDPFTGECTPVTTVPGALASCDDEYLDLFAAATLDMPRRTITGPKKCDGAYAAWDVDYGSGSCPADDTGPNPCANLRVHRVFWRGVDGAWVLLGYQGTGDCAEARTYDPSFPDAICTP
jgi:hypothetical protein